MVAADDDRSAELAVLDHFVESKTKTMAITKANPADTRRQALEGDALGGHIKPIVQVLVVGQQFLHLGIGLADVFRITR
ncbi:hypothetical protein D3C72_2344460 [compost metagenome]